VNKNVKISIKISQNSGGEKLKKNFLSAIKKKKKYTQNVSFLLS
jgi:hypothetical protein